MEFQADSIEYWSQNGIETVFFGNEEKELALVMSSVPGTADHYFEWNDQSNACNNAVKTIELSGQHLHLELLPEAAQQLGMDKLSVKFEVGEDVLKEILRCLNIIFGKKFVVKKAAHPQKTAPPKEYNTIRYLNLENKNLRELPDYVREMAALETVKLARNPKLDFQAVCEVLATLPNVRELTFSPVLGVPETIGKLANLETLSLTDFTVPLALPEGFGQLKKLKSLLVMGDSDVILPESFAELSALEQLNMRTTTWLPPSKFYQLSKLTLLDFSNSRLTRLPEEVAGMTEVKTVVLGSPEDCDYAQMLSVIARMPNLKTLDLYAGAVTKEIGLCRQIEELRFWTSFDAQTPMQLAAELFELTQLKNLFFSLSRFEEIPAAIGNLKGLEGLTFNESDFETLPDSVGELSNLTFLGISENPSLRALPDSLGKLSQLKTLILADNPLLTRLPDGLRNLKNLESVTIPDRMAVANIPEHWSGFLR